MSKVNKVSKNKDSKADKKENIFNKKINFSDIMNKKSNKPAKKKLLKAKDVDFLYRYEVVVENKQPKVDPKFYLIPGVTVVSILVAIIVIMQVMLLVNTNKNKRINEYLNDPQNISQYEVAQGIKSDIAKRREEITGIKNVLDTINMYPNLDKALVDVMFGTAGKNNVAIDNMNYNCQQGYLSIECRTTDVNCVPKFVGSLQATDYFNLVTYTGYTGSSESGAEGGNYTFTVNCICKAN